MRFLLLLLLLPFSIAIAQPTDTIAIPDRVLQIGTKVAPPFSIKKADGSWEGISIDLWRDIALKLEIDYEFVETDLDGLINGVESGELDAAVAALSVTAEREGLVDFTHPFYSGGLGIAVRPGGGGGFLRILENFLSIDFLTVILLLFASMLVVGGLIWVFERRANPDQFPDSTMHGIGAGLWWAVVTLTTVGYGDKAPTTVPGRILAVVWMFSALIIVASFTAALTSVLTVSELDAKVKGPNDLPRVKVGALEGSVGAQYLDKRQIEYVAYDTVQQGLHDVADGKIDAMVHDAPILTYWINQELTGSVAVLPKTFDDRYYAIALHRASPLRKPVNQEILRIRQSRDWELILQRYLGK
jgi:ABC-type amino acid transport substrate-binding protein